MFGFQRICSGVKHASLCTHRRTTVFMFLRFHTTFNQDYAKSCLNIMSFVKPSQEFKLKLVLYSYCLTVQISQDCDWRSATVCLHNVEQTPQNWAFLDALKGIAATKHVNIKKDTDSEKHEILIHKDFGHVLGNGSLFSNTRTQINICCRMCLLITIETAMAVKEATFESWKKTNRYLTINSSNTIITCELCKKWSAKLTGTNASITGSRIWNPQPFLNTYKANFTAMR